MQRNSSARTGRMFFLVTLGGANLVLIREGLINLWPLHRGFYYSESLNSSNASTASAFANFSIL